MKETVGEHLAPFVRGAVAEAVTAFNRGPWPKCRFCHGRGTISGPWASRMEDRTPCDCDGRPVLGTQSVAHDALSAIALACGPLGYSRSPDKSERDGRKFWRQCHPVTLYLDQDGLLRPR